MSERDNKDEQTGRSSPKPIQNCDPQISPDSKKQRSLSPNPSHHSDPSNPFLVRPSPPQYVVLEEIMKAAEGVNNMALAHEIAINSEFTVQKPNLPENSLSKRVEQIMQQAFWDSLEEKITQEKPDYSQILMLIQEIKETTETLLPQHSQTFKNQLNEFMDLDLIKQEIENECFEIQKTVNFILELLSKICAPVRDEEVASLKKTEGVVNILKGIFKLLDNMKLDFTNFTIQQVRPIIQKQSAEYEREKFEKFLKVQSEHGVDGLEFTRKWLENAYKQLKVRKSEQDAFSIMPQELLCEAYLDLLEKNNNSNYPETLVMDASRIVALSDKAKRSVLVASIVLVVFNSVGASIAGLEQLKSDLKSHMESIIADFEFSKIKENISSNICEQVAKDVDDALEKHGFSKMTNEKCDLLKSNVASAFENDHPVRTVLWNRYRAFLKGLLLTFSIPQGQVKIPQGLSIVADPLGTVAGQMLRLCRHNRSTFGIFYADIIKSLIHIPIDGDPTTSTSKSDTN